MSRYVPRTLAISDRRGLHEAGELLHLDDGARRSAAVTGDQDRVARHPPLLRPLNDEVHRGRPELGAVGQTDLVGRGLRHGRSLADAAAAVNDRGGARVAACAAPVHAPAAAGRRAVCGRGTGSGTADSSALV